jgi:lysyl endopeptidase
MHRTVALAIAGLALSFAVHAAPPSQQYELPSLEADATLVLPPIDRAKLVAAEDDKRPGPVRYAVASEHDVAATPTAAKRALGTWTTLPNGRQAWRLAVHSPGALSLDFGFERLFLPHGAELYLSTPDGRVVRGPYTDADHTPFGGFWTPYVPGDTALLEVVVPAAMKPFLVVELSTVHSAFRAIEGEDESLAKDAGSCNVDIACPAGDAYRQQQRAVARYTFSGFMCSGQLVNDTAGDNRRFFITANHCMDSQADANSFVAYWRYESPVCRPTRTPQNAVPLDDDISVVQTGGATLRMTNATPDTTLVEINTAIPPAAMPYFDGWDRRDITSPRAAVVHHPQGEEKRIAVEDDPIAISNAPLTNIPGTRHFVIEDWDVGTTEQGSSGSGLLNADKRLIGVLSGGSAGCAFSSSDDADGDGDNDGFDAFGRLPVAWDLGTTPATRLRDWLDANNSGALFIDGKEVCTAPTLALTGPATIAAGQSATFNLTVTGGQGPYTVAWDLDGDGTTDRTTTGVTGSSSISPVFPNAQSVNIVARVSDAANCPAEAQRALVVTAPVVEATAAAPVQVCGDNDAAIEPGERWRVPVTLRNTGTVAMQDGHAIFARGQGAPAGAEYTIADSTQGNACPFQAIDLGAAAALPLVPTDDAFDAEDDGHTNPIALTQPFDFFGATVTQIVMSTNGYLSTSSGDSGGDYDNSCPVDTPDRGSEGARFNVLHDDLALRGNGALRSAYFATCPRPGNSGAGPRGCTVFEWRNMARVTEGGAGRDGTFTLQAILYDGTNQIVYQYLAADPEQGGQATIGIQDDGNTRRAQYGCDDEGKAPANRAVCFFHPSAPAGAGDPARIRLLTPSAPLANLGANAQSVADALFEVDAGAACGAPLALDYVGSVDTVAHTLRTTRILDTTVGGGGACQAFTGFCPSPPNAELPKRDGLYSSLVRFGNGMGAFNIPTPEGTVFGGQWYTGKRDRTPEWLILQGPIADNQADVPIYRFRRTGTNPFTVASTIVGRAQITYTSATDYVATWVLDGVPAGEKLTLLYGTNRPSPNRTGSWFPPSESGWGLAIDDHFLPNGQSEQVIVNYFYDAANNPVWTLGGGSITGGTQPQNLFRVHCPSCPSLPDLLNDIRPAGTVTTTYTGLTTGTYSTAITFPPPVTGDWFRTNLPIQMISSPQAASGDAANDDTTDVDDATPPQRAARTRGPVFPTTVSRRTQVIR